MKHFCVLLTFLLSYCFAVCQPPDSVAAILPDTTIQKRDSVIAPKQTALSKWQKILDDHPYINVKDAPVNFAARERVTYDRDALFYMLAGLILFFGIVRTIYDRYFQTLFRVFFNSSLRQSQLTDQLLQSKLPSLYFNLIFVFAGGFYVYFLLERLFAPKPDVQWVLLGGCIALFIVVYMVKFLTLKFVGWVTGYRSEADTYTFVLFLINKIIGICLLPVIVVLSFSGAGIANIIMIVSFLLVGILLLFRFIRSYGLLQHKLNVSRFHFMLYIIAMEILPLMLIYKAVGVFIVKSL
ncbi:MAG: DUF4271 domain-containing protein [Chitinophagaceae bacterium]|nr:MAG: DUF4271 domain-containing protein [Chitinophagaceae bacterium]